MLGVGAVCYAPMRVDVGDVYYAPKFFSGIARGRGRRARWCNRGGQRRRRHTRRRGARDPLHTQSGLSGGVSWASDVGAVRYAPMRVDVGDVYYAPMRVDVGDVYYAPKFS
jgi:hypothetical protein